MSEVAEKRAELYRDRDRHMRLDRLQDVQISLFHLSGRLIGIGWDGVDVQLESVGPGLLNFLGKVSPTARRGAIEARDDRDLHRFFSLADVLEILLGPDLKLLRFRKISQSFRITLRAVGKM